jgi:hypothetical protein
MAWKYEVEPTRVTIRDGNMTAENMTKHRSHMFPRDGVDGEGLTEDSLLKRRGGQGCAEFSRNHLGLRHG